MNSRQLVSEQAIFGIDLMTRNKSQDETEDKLHQIQTQLQKLMEGMSSMNDRNSQVDKELLEIREAVGYLNQKGKEKDPARAESNSGRDCLG
ncbi:hypothetical protein KY289_026339 [Solanum tuberosum]|nr:hypothetical protein KY289_026339 [Solanum tuberosum]